MIKQKAARTVGSAVLALMASFAFVATGCKTNVDDGGEPNNPSVPNPTPNPGTGETVDFTATSQNSYEVSYDKAADTYTVTLEDESSGTWNQQIYFVPKSESFTAGEFFHLSAEVTVDKAVNSIFSKVQWNASSYSGTESNYADVEANSPVEIDYYGTVADDKNDCLILFDIRGNSAGTVVKIKGLKIETVDSLPKPEYEDIVLYDISDSINLLDTGNIVHWWSSSEPASYTFEVTDEGLKTVGKTSDCFGIPLKKSHPVRNGAKLVVNYTANADFELKPVAPDSNLPADQSSGSFTYKYTADSILSTVGIVHTSDDSEILITYIAITDNEDAE